MPERDSAGYRPVRGSFAWEGGLESAEQDAYPNSAPDPNVARFLREECTDDRFPSGAPPRVSAKKLYEALTDWWKNEELPAGELPTRNALARHITRAGFPRRCQEWDNRLQENVHYRLGIRLKLKAELAADDDRASASGSEAGKASLGAATPKRRAAK